PHDGAQREPPEEYADNSRGQRKHEALREQRANESPRACAERRPQRKRASAPTSTSSASRVLAPTRSPGRAMPATMLSGNRRRGASSKERKKSALTSLLAASTVTPGRSRAMVSTN